VPVILTAGRQDPQKDQVTLLAAFDRVAMDHPDALLLVAGRKGSSTPVLEAEQARMRHADRVRMLGHRDDVPELMAAADVFAFPSAWEGLGGAAIEAMALGLPVVASDIPALHEVVAEGVTGLFVPSKQPVMLARALSSLLDDPQRARGLGAAGLRVFMDRFTIERSAQRMRDLYMELLRGRKPVAEAA
jgi:glycosyltransferase involved in cell wall biosynthesis